ncbi:MAG: ECF transporter S component [Bacilli bacterium]
MNIKVLTRTAILTAIVFVAMSLLHINIFNSSLHLGSLIIVIISLKFNKKEAIIASSLGPTLFDIFSGYMAYAPFTFSARFLLSFIVSKAKNKSFITQILYAFIGGCIVIAVYFVSYLLLLGGLRVSLLASIPDVLQLLLTILGVFIANAITNIYK